jgi:predicted glycosyltransferase involved in capsule biosynthesis
MGDVLTYVSKNVNENNYISMACYSVNKRITLKETIENFKILPQQSVSAYIGWYNHSKYRPVHYHFCAALTKRNLNILGGFDERYAMGIGYEDNEFIDRVKRLNLEMVIADDVPVIHQWHPKVYDLVNSKYLDLYGKNALLHKQTKKESIIHV